MKDLIGQHVLYISIMAVFLLAAHHVSAQTTEFTYQGRLQNGGSAAAGNYDFEFLLFDALSDGSQIGPVLTRNGVPVADGIFSVNLDFGPNFPGPSRFLEIRVRPSGPGAYTPLSPRQTIRSSPYSIKTISADFATTATNATQLGGVPASQFVQNADPRLSDARAPVAGSSSYVQNQNAAAQPATNFNISGDGTAGGTISAGVVNSANQYNIGGNRMLSAAGSDNLFVGKDAGLANTTGFLNTFAGAGAGQSNTVGVGNSFVGGFAGATNTTGSSNSFFGKSAGQTTSTGGNNSFYGANAGFSNTIGSSNSFFGVNTGASNTTSGNNSFFGEAAGASSTGSNNSFFGRTAGSSNTSGFNNAFFGFNAGNTNTTGGHNTVIGYDADVGGSSLNFATAIGAGSVVSSSNTVVLGRASDTVQVPGNLNVAGTFTGNINGAGITNLNAGNIATGTLNNARLGQIPTANIADSAVTAPKIASGQVVKSLNTLKDDVTLAAGSNITITPAGNTLTIASTGGGNPILNQTTQQAGANFNISGNGTAGGTFSSNIVNAATQYDIGGSRILSRPGSGNLFAGLNAGTSTTGAFNSFFGNNAGSGTLGGVTNSFFGRNAGTTNVTGNFNTAIGGNADFGSSGLANATTVGAYALVSQSNSLVLGSIAGINFGPASTNVGIGITAPTSTLHVISGNATAGDNTATFQAAASIGPNQSHIHFGTNGNWFIRSAANAGRVVLQDTGGNVGIGTASPNAKLQVTGGSIYVSNPNSLIITSPNGTCWFITVSDLGALASFSVPCP